MSTTTVKLTLTNVEPQAPSDLREALEATPLALAPWRDITPIARRDFITWIESAKQPATRQHRIEVTCSKLVSGQRRPCCYAVVPMNLYKALGTNPQAKAVWSTLSPDERRDWSDWIESGEDATARKHLVEEGCRLLAAGQRHP